MAERNQKVVSEFLLLGLPIQPEHQCLFYALFLAMYLTTILGNLIIIVFFGLDSHVHTPMYLFLSNLSFSDLCFSSVTVPKLQQNLQSQVSSIPYAGYLGNFLLVAMANDHYTAIYFPVHYTIIMNLKLCMCQVVLSWVLTTLHDMLHTLLMARLSFCANNVIPHYFCDMSALLNLLLVIPLALIIMSYVPSSQGIPKALSTCASHLSVVTLFYGTVIGLYLCPPDNNSTVKETVMSLMYTVVTSMLNPFIYSLRNRDIKGALERIFCKRKTQLNLRW
uniref:G-protein coupled receptors family 1 profile domain-containing protein n=1 Tax=Nannospalax galili TaxID=1026970 RepID=A0A8C6QRS2_NANGA